MAYTLEFNELQFTVYVVDFIFDRTWHGIQDVPELKENPEYAIS